MGTPVVPAPDDATAPGCAGAGPASPHGDVGAELVRLLRLVGSVKAQAAARAPNGLDWSAYGVLFHLVTHGPQRSKALAERMHTDPSTVSRQASALVDLGLVERHPDPDDGRAALLGASPQGHELFATMRTHRDQMFAAVLADWDPQDAALFTELLGRFNLDFERHIVEVLQMVQLDAASTTRPPTLQETS